MHFFTLYSIIFFWLDLVETKTEVITQVLAEAVYTVYVHRFSSKENLLTKLYFFHTIFPTDFTIKKKVYEIKCVILIIIERYFHEDNMNIPYKELSIRVISEMKCDLTSSLSLRVSQLHENYCKFIHSETQCNRGLTRWWQTLRLGHRSC